jgi:predicted alpha/beta superfamily hydrolase
VLYVLDGNVHFNTATDALTRQSFRIPPPTVAPATVVGIGYPTHDPDEVNRRRVLDLTLSKNSPSPFRPEARAGGGDTFLRVIEEELKPFVMARYKIDRTKQIIYGQSLGGLMALRVLFRNPNAFSSYILSSPSISHNNSEVLADEEAFSKRARAGELRLRVLVTSAADEQYRGEDPKLLAAANLHRMVDNASELADRLAALNPSKIMVVRTIFAGETHMSVPPASLSRALRFALPRD